MKTQPAPAAPSIQNNEGEQSKTAVNSVRVVYPSPEAGGSSNVAPAIAPTADSKAVMSVGPVVASTPPTNAQSSNSVPTAPAINLPGPDGQPLGVKPGININSGSIESLNNLDGGGRIGASIVRHRPYNSIEDLLTKRVVRKDVYERIRNQLAVQ